MHSIIDLKRARLFGHPVHLMMNHFPAALFPLAVLFDAAGFFLQDKLFALAAFFSLGAGLAGGLLAIITGAVDFLNIPTDKSREYKTAALHAGLNILWMGIYAVFFGLRISQYPDIGIISRDSLIISALATAGLIYSNYLGGELLLRYKIGLKDE